MINRDESIRMLKDEGCSELEAENLIDYSLLISKTEREYLRLQRLLDAVEGKA